MFDRTIDVDIDRDHRGVYIATSREMPGLHLVGKDVAELMEKLPEAARLLAEVDGVAPPNRLCVTKHKDGWAKMLELARA